MVIMATGLPHVHRRRACQDTRRSLEVQIPHVHMLGHLDAAVARDDRVSAAQVQGGDHDDSSFPDLLGWVSLETWKENCFVR
jgi:hypothetical protein